MDREEREEGEIVGSLGVRSPAKPKPTTKITHQYYINPNCKKKKKKPTTKERQSERWIERRGKRVRSTVKPTFKLTLPSSTFNHQPLAVVKTHLPPSITTMANPSTTINESDAAAAVANFNEVVATFPLLLVAATTFFCTTFFLLASDCKKRKNTGWELGRERETDSEKGERKNQIKK